VGATAGIVKVGVMTASHVLPLIRRMNPAIDHQRIVFMSFFFDFPFDGFVVSNLILLRSFSVPRISMLLDATGVFYRQGQSRLARLVRAVAQLIMCGYDSARGLGIIRGMNATHDRYDTNNDDYLYVLSRFVVEPVCWTNRFGWRPMIKHEKLALYYFWREVGRRMNVERFPASYAELEEFSKEFERAHCRPETTNHRLFLALEDIWLGRCPAVLRPGLRHVFRCLLGQSLRRDLMAPDPPGIIAGVVTRLVRLRKLTCRWLPPRRVPFHPLVRLVESCATH
jgi:hypothetical protein